MSDLAVTGGDSRPSSSSPLNPGDSRSEGDNRRNSPIELSLFQPNVDIEAGSQSQQAQPDNSPYHIFSRRQKWNLVFLVSLAGSFSPLSSNIYFPAIDSISSELGVSTSLVALTITVYMVVQGIAPSVFGAVSDASGRRFTFTIVLAIYTGANLALAYTSNYPMLLVLRGVQAAGSSATISISTGVIADITAPSERGGFMGTNAGIRYVNSILTPWMGQLLTKTE
jgi:sugar phosphate permease